MTGEEKVESIVQLKLLSKNCHIDEMQCAMCSSSEECKAQLKGANSDEPEFGSNHKSGVAELIFL